MTQIIIAAILAAASLLGALASWYGPNRNAMVERDNRLRNLYSDIMKAILALNGEMKEFLDKRNRGIEGEYSEAAFRKRQIRVEAIDTARAPLFVEPYDLVSPVIKAIEKYLELYRWQTTGDGDLDDSELVSLTKDVQYQMGRSTYARMPLPQLRLWLAFRHHRQATKTASKNK